MEKLKVDHKKEIARHVARMPMKLREMLTLTTLSLVAFDDVEEVEIIINDIIKEIDHFKNNIERTKDIVISNITMKNNNKNLN